VWACARRPEHLQALGRVAGVVPVALDVRDAAQVQAVEHALFDAVPRARYLVGTRWEGLRVVDALLDRLLDADEGVGMGLGRDALVARLDERLAARRAK
jgi:hypothetical protein